MMDQPSILELVEAVRNFLETKAMPELKGHNAFHARVAANALGIVVRELRQGPTAADVEMSGLREILGPDGSLDNLNRELCARIRSGALSVESPALQQHLEQTTMDKVAIDQPNYSGLKIARQ